jgi:hypothetical protein
LAAKHFARIDPQKKTSYPKTDHEKAHPAAMACFNRCTGRAAVEEPQEAARTTALML